MDYMTTNEESKMTDRPVMPHNLPPYTRPMTDEELGEYAARFARARHHPAARATYKVVRFTADDANEHNHETIATGLTLEEAQGHCEDDATHGDDAEHGGPWFDGYTEES
jgi:hypothetical protein